jgi:hypothetical protein
MNVRGLFCTKMTILWSASICIDLISGFNKNKGKKSEHLSITMDRPIQVSPPML